MLFKCKHFESNMYEKKYKTKPLKSNGEVYKTNKIKCKPWLTNRTVLNHTFTFSHVVNTHT